MVRAHRVLEPLKACSRQTLTHFGILNQEMKVLNGESEYDEQFLLNAMDSRYYRLSSEQTSLTLVRLMTYK